MAITSGYTHDAEARMREECQEATNQWRKNFVNTTSKSIHPDGSDHPPVCSKPSTRMVDSIHPDGSDHPPVCSKPSTRMRKKGGITQDMFRTMDWHERLELVKKYDDVKDKDFDDGTFAFSVTTFKNLCHELHIERVTVDELHQDIVSSAASEHSSDGTIYISRTKRDNVKEKTLTLSAATVASMNELLEGSKMTNEERSKVIDAIIAEAFSRKIDDMHNGHFGVEYKEKLEPTAVKNKLI